MLTVCMLYFLCEKILGGSYLILGIPIFMYKQSLTCIIIGKHSLHMISMISGIVMPDSGSQPDKDSL